VCVQINIEIINVSNALWYVITECPPPLDTNHSFSTMFIVAISSGEDKIISNATDKPTNYLSVLNLNFMAAQTQPSTLTRLFLALNRMICNIHAVVTTNVCGAQVSVLCFVGTLYVEQNYNGLTLWHSKLSYLSLSAAPID
jgi:hypothetical protein